MSKKVRIISAIVLSLACYFYFAVSSQLYLSSDNFMVAVVTNGLFGDNNFCQYLHPLLCLIIRALALLFPTADAFTVLKDAFIFGELALVFYLLTAPLEKRKAWHIESYLCLAVAIMAVVFLSMGINLWWANYTIPAGSFVATGMALVFAGKRYRHPRWLFLGAVYAAIGFMLRKECGLLVVPFAALHVGADFLVSSDRRDEMHDFTRYILPSVIIVALLLGSQALFNSFEPYATAARYNDNRTVCVDFPMKSWAETDYPDQATYLAATDWTFFDTDNMTADVFEAVANAGTRSEYALNSRGIRSALYEMRRVAFRTDVYMAVIVVLVILLAVWNTVFSHGLWRRLEAVAAIVGAFVILFYFTMRGRAPLRIWQPVMFATVVIQALLFIDNWSSKTGNLLFTLLIGILLYYSAGQVIAHASFHAPVTAWNSRVGADDSEYRFDALYIWPNWHATIPEYFRDQDKLPTRRVLENNIAAGDWTYGQPFYNVFLARIGASNPALELVEGRAYVMEGNAKIIEGYLQECYGADIRLETAGFEIDEREAYRVVRGEE